jgi:hypothetical protein
MYEEVFRPCLGDNAGWKDNEGVLYVLPTQIGVRRISKPVTFHYLGPLASNRNTSPQWSTRSMMTATEVDHQPKKNCYGGGELVRLHSSGKKKLT